MQVYLNLKEVDDYHNDFDVLVGDVPIGRILEVKNGSVGACRDEDRNFFVTFDNRMEAIDWLVGSDGKHF
jgi:hypothetical protein